MNRHVRSHGRAIVMAVAVICWLAIIAAFALSQINKAQQGTAVAIAIPAAVVFFGVLAWLGWQGRGGGTS